MSEHKYLDIFYVDKLKEYLYEEIAFAKEAPRRIVTKTGFYPLKVSLYKDEQTLKVVMSLNGKYMYYPERNKTTWECISYFTMKPDFSIHEIVDDLIASLDEYVQCSSCGLWVRDITKKYQRCEPCNFAVCFKLEEDCSICMEPISDGEKAAFVTPCHHIFHYRCVVGLSRSCGSLTCKCPLCRQLFIVTDNQLLEFIREKVKN